LTTSLPVKNPSFSISEDGEKGLLILYPDYGHLVGGRSTGA
jgi:hypothetical protein